MTAMRSPVRLLLIRALLVLAFLASVLGLPAGQAQAATSVTLSGTAAGRVFDGVGAVSGGGGNAKLLYDYPEPQRGQILDYLFKPGYGANISLLKVEIGGDANSTDGAEPSHMHTADDQNYQRGYEWWLMEQAKARNPGIKLAALAWAAPGWIGTSDVWTKNMITYLVNYLRGARDVHGLTIDYLGGWNENGWDSGWFVDLRKALDAGGFGHVQLVGADGGWDVVTDMQNNQAFNDAIAVVGAHYPCEGVSESTGDRCESPAAAQNLGKPLWASENGSQDYNANGPVMARQLSRGYIDAKMTAYINWPLIAALPPGLPFQTTGLMVAPQPWSGQYSVGKGLWVQAHWNQFAKPGWQFADSASGYLSGDRNIGSYVTLKAPGNTDYTTIIETTRATATEQFTARVTDGLPTGTLHVWATNLNSANPSDWFVRQADITPSGGTWSLTLQPGRIYSISTAGGQGKGSASGPASASFPLPHTDGFDAYATGREARYLADQHGSFETAGCGGGRGGQCLRQTAPVAPIPWHPHQSPAYALIGDNSLTDYTVQSDVMFERTGGSVALLGRFGARDYWQVGQINAYYLKVGQAGTWQILRGDTAGALTVLASGTRTALDANTWHKLAFRLQGSTLTAIADGVTLGSAEDTAYGLGPAGLAVGVGENSITSRWRNVQFDNFSITPGTTTTYKIVNRSSGKVLAVAGSSSDDGAAIVQQADTGVASQRWRVVQDGGYVQLVNTRSNRALDVPGFSTTQGTQLVQWTVNGGENQQWTLGTANDGYQTLVNRHSGYLADVSGASGAQDAPVVQWPSNGGANQQWQLEAS
ncbi:galactosylceramidase [Streptomyces albiflavescens]|uniref:galactosylceramidase n=1 Tax=Streptomyces albiflavescens TaxID=1623582 RepID=A0A917XR19_9ACTN|nr:RICIN domain-containing protein [Streptomyces albiflavescens]GGN49972.1 galactosylceramidase [Streptomyces albiflavescens]